MDLRERERERESVYSYVCVCVCMCVNVFSGTLTNHRYIHAAVLPSMLLLVESHREQIPCACGARAHAPGSRGARPCSHAEQQKKRSRRRQCMLDVPDQVMERTAIEITGGTTEWTSRRLPVLLSLSLVEFMSETLHQAQPEESDGEVWRGCTS